MMTQAMDHVRLQRWFINPNPGFKNQMKRFEKELLSGPPQNAGQKDAEESK